MRLVKEAKTIAWRSYSLWLNRIAFALMILPEVIYALTGRDPVSPYLLFWVGAVLYIAVEFARYVDQNIVRSSSTVTVAAFLLVAVPLVSKWEGKENHAYLDRIASPPVWTICHGETRGVKQGDFKTDAECTAMLKRGLITYRTGLHRYFTTETKQNRLTPERDAAYVSLAWNVGIRAAGRSTATRRLNAGNIVGGCDALTWWNRAGNRVVRGLVRRRADEYRLCMKGLA